MSVAIAHGNRNLAPPLVIIRICGSSLWTTRSARVLFDVRVHLT